jgi:hypothetical protein
LRRLKGEGQDGCGAQGRKKAARRGQAEETAEDEVCAEAFKIGGGQSGAPSEGAKGDEGYCEDAGQAKRQ